MNEKKLFQLEKDCLPKTKKWTKKDPTIALTLNDVVLGPLSLGGDLTNLTTIV